jgi:phage-related minor tail protein
MANKSIGLLTIAFGANLKGFEKAMKKAQRSIKKFGTSMKKTGQNLTRNVTLPIIGLGTVAVKTFADFEQSMLKVKAVSGATANEFKNLQNSARELGSSTMFTASQVADLQFELAKLGFDPGEIDKAQASILALSQATTHDLAQSGEIVAATLNSFNMEASESARVADVFALASSNAAIDMEKLAASMPKVGAIAGALNMDVEKLTAQMMTLADRGMEASTMGTSLRKIFIDLSAKGISLEDALDAINTAIDPVTKATELFGNRAAAAAVILAQNTQTTSEYESELRKAGGTAFKMAEIMDSGINGALRRLKSASQDVAIEIGGMLIPVLNKLMNIIKNGIAFWKGLDKDTRKTIVAFGLVLASIGPILTIVGSLTTAFSLLFSPVGLVIGALISGGLLIYKYWNDLKQPIVDIVNYMINLYNESMLVRGAVQLIIVSFKNLWSQIKFVFNLAQKLISTTLEAWKNQFFALGTIIEGAFTFDWDKFTKGGESFTKSIVDGYKNMGKDILSESTILGDEMAKNLKEGFEDFMAKDKIEFITTDDIDNAVNKASELVNKVVTKIKSSLGLNGSGGIGSDNTSPSVQTPSEQLGIEGDALNLDMGSPDWLYDLGDGYDFINQKIEKTRNLMETLSEVFGLNKTVLLEYAKQLGTTLEQGANSFEEYAKMAKNAIRETISGMIAQGVATAVTSALSNPGIKINPLLIPVVAGLAAGLAKTAFKSLIPAFADGGIISGPTVGLMGEYPGAASNPEVVAPLNKLKSMLGDSGGGKVEVYGRISGNDIFISNQRGSINRQRSV